MRQASWRKRRTYRVESRRHGGLRKKENRNQKQQRGIPKQGINEEEGKGETLLKFWMESRGWRETVRVSPFP